MLSTELAVNIYIGSDILWLITKLKQARRKSSEIKRSNFHTAKITYRRKHSVHWTSELNKSQELERMTRISV